MQSSVKKRKNSIRRGANRGGIALGIVGFLLLAVVFFAIGYFFLGPRISPTSLSAQNSSTQERPAFSFGREREPESAADIPDLKITRHADTAAKPRENVQPSEESAPKSDEENSITVTMDSGNGETELKDKAPAPKLRPRPIAKAEKPSGGTYRVQVGAYASRENAERLANELADRGYSATIRSTSSEDRTLYRVQLGTFKSRSDAQSLVGHLEDDGYQPAVSMGD